MNATKKILVAEDNMADAELMKISFENLDISEELLHFKNGKILLDYLEDNDASNVLLVILDLNMPVMNGVDALRMLKKHPKLKKLPVIIFSSSKYDKDIATCYDLGANAYVAKPMNIEEFDDTIRSITSFWGDINVRMATYA